MWLNLKCSLANIAYNAIERAARFIADINPHVTVETIDIGPSYTLDAIFRAFEAAFQKVQSSPEYIALTEQGKRPKIVTIVDALSASPGLLMPWERVVEFSKRHENMWTLVDAAHAIGQIVGIDLNKTQPDFFISVRSISFAMRLTETEPLWFDRTATNGCMRSEDVQFFMSH